MDHDEAVTKHHLVAQNTLDDGYWDSVYRETSYYENCDCPHPPYPEEKGREVGEFDVLLVNYDDKLAFYKEVKTSYGDMLHAKNQIERAEEFFEEAEGDWEIIGRRVLED